MCKLYETQLVFWLVLNQSVLLQKIIENGWNRNSLEIRPLSWSKF